MSPASLRVTDTRASAWHLGVSVTKQLHAILRGKGRLACLLHLLALHELTLMEDLVCTVLENSGSRKVVAVRLVVGAASGVVADALRFCFDICVEGTQLEGAALEIIEDPGSRLLLKDVEVA